MLKALAGFFASAIMLLTLPAAAGETISISCGSVGQDLSSCKEGAEAWAKATGNTIKVVTAPSDSGEQLTLFQQLLAAGSSDVDVFRIDVIWPGILGSHLLDLREHFQGDVLGQHFAPIVQNNTVDGHLLGIPWYTDAGLLYYRKDLLEKHGQKPPTTWQELKTVAKLVQDKEREAGNPKMVGFVFQGRSSEGLTCNALEWVDSFGGGTVVSDDGKVTINNPKAVAAIDFVASMIDTIAPKGVLSYDEEASRGVFQSGNAVFMRNWPYAWAMSQSADSPVKGKVAVMALPKGGPDGKSTGTLGGWQLAVSKYSKHPKLAVDLVKYLAGAQEQKRRALVASFNPTIGNLYKDPEILKANPFMSSLYDTFTHAVARPSKKTGLKYSRVSAEFRNAVHATLSGKGTAAANLEKLQRKLEVLSNKGRW